MSHLLKRRGRSRSYRKRKKSKRTEDEGPPSKKQRTSISPQSKLVAVSVPFGNQPNSDHLHQQSSIRDARPTHSQSQPRISSPIVRRFTNEDVIFEKRIVQIGQTQKEFLVADLMHFDFFRKRYSKLWAKCNRKREQHSKHHDNQKVVEQDFDNTDDNDSASVRVQHHARAVRQPSPSEDGKLDDEDEDDDAEHDDQPLDADSDEECDGGAQTPPLTLEESADGGSHDGADEMCDICNILVDNFDVNDLANLIFFVNAQKIPISMNYNDFASFIAVADFFTVQLKTAHFQHYFQYYPHLIPYAMFEDWKQLKSYTVKNRKQLQSAIEKYCEQYRTISGQEKKKLALQIQRCLQRIVEFDKKSDYNQIDLRGLCFEKTLQIVQKSDDGEGNQLNQCRVAFNNGQTITIRSTHQHQTGQQHNSNSNSHNHNHNHNHNRNQSISSDVPILRQCEANAMGLHSGDGAAEDAVDNGAEVEQETKLSDTIYTQYLTGDELRRLNERTLMVYWNGLKALHLKLHHDFNPILQQCVLSGLDAVVAYFGRQMESTRHANIAARSKVKLLQYLPFSKLMHILTDIYALLWHQRGEFSKWASNVQSVFKTIEKLAGIFFTFNVQTISTQDKEYDLDEYEQKNTCFTELFKTFLTHLFKNGPIQFKVVLKTLVFRRPFMTYLYDQEDFMLNVMFKQIRMSVADKIQLAKKLQTCNVYKNAEWQANKNQNDDEQFTNKYTDFIQQVLGVTDQSDSSLLMSL